jgi:hypothetical protein
MVFFEHCQGCAAFNFMQCPGGYRQIKEGRCLQKVSLKETPGLVEVTFQPHAYVMEGRRRALYLINLAEKSTGNISDDIRFTPYYTGHVHSNGNICTGTMKIEEKVPVFATEYLKLWGALHTGHLWPSMNLKKSMSLASLLKNMSIDFLKVQSIKHEFTPNLEKPWKEQYSSRFLRLAVFEDTFVETLYKFRYNQASTELLNLLGIRPRVPEDCFFVENTKGEVIPLNQFPKGACIDPADNEKVIPPDERRVFSSVDFQEILKTHTTYIGGIR